VIIELTTKYSAIHEAMINYYFLFDNNNGDHSSSPDNNYEILEPKGVLMRILSSQA
jgi:hypothetical protein